MTTAIRPLPRRPRLASALCGLLLALAAAGAQAQRASSIVIQGKDNWLFPGWGSLTQVDTRGIDAATQLVRETRDALAARGVQLEVLVLPAKRCSTRTSCRTARR